MRISQRFLRRLVERTRFFMEFTDSLQEFLFRQGFKQIQHRTKLLWVKEKEGQIFLIEIIPELLRGQSRRPLEEYEAELRKLEGRIMLKYRRKVEGLFLKVCEGMPESEDMREAQNCRAVWFIDRTEGEVYVYESQPADYCEIRDSLECFSRTFGKKKKAENKRELRQMFTPVNTVVVAINIIVFVVLCFLGDTEDANFMAMHGAMTWQGIVIEKEYYRLVTSMFLHFGAEHLLQNMLTLMVMGCRLERIVGRWRYIVIYAGAGLTASFASLFFTLADRPYLVSAGASGAIFGVMGSVLFLLAADVAQRERSRLEEIGLTGIVFMVGAALSYGFFSDGIDNAAHVGGLIGGFILTAAMFLFRKNKKRL